ncbi:hypothetical protein J5N97_025193 [Dioscorea zingiberensis]|uniref:Myb/SANT-like DNA-binding domain-containing protein n=1 Tax=Dioscorea zingiberensis TaxID=325984 RepID=A0A9D5C7U7_9LILI|nr:hypothetical protein J5N97_025193 [Dioscorea zingiberensis]
MAVAKVEKMVLITVYEVRPRRRRLSFSHNHHAHRKPSRHQGGSGYNRRADLLRETLALIESYREKWYELRRGNLRATHWQEVAESVARPCRNGPGATPKTSVQRRHQVETLRKRYRAERQRSLNVDPSAPPSLAVALLSSPPLHGGWPLRPRPPDEEEEEDDHRSGQTRSLHRLMENGGPKFTIPKAVRSKIVGSRTEERPTPVQNPNPSSRSRLLGGFGRMGPAVEEMRLRLDKTRRRSREKDEGDAMGEVVSALRMLGDRFMRMEQMKMEQAREMEKVRMEMELKRTEMVLDSQRRIVDAFVNGLLGKKRAKVSPES